MSVVVFLCLQACLLIPSSLSFPVIPLSKHSVDLVHIQGTPHTGGDPHYATVDLQQWPSAARQPLSPSNIIHGAQIFPPSNKGSDNTILPQTQNAKHTVSSSVVNSLPQGDSYKSIAQSVNKNGAIKHTKLQQNTPSNKLKVQFKKSGVLEFFPSHQKVQTNGGKENSKQGREAFKEIPISTDDTHTLQLAVQQDFKGEGQQGVSQYVITLATSLAALFTLGLVVGIFGCCCPKKQHSDENENKNDKQNATNETEAVKMTKANQKPSEIINPSDIPTGEKDLDDTVSVKDKIKALDNKLIIQPSPDHVVKRKSHIETNNVNQPHILISEDDVVMRDKSKSKSIGDNISKSDTQDDISDKIFDNVSMHSSISQPHNPDVVIADSDEGDEFAELQRGTVILKSFQRAKPPRNRSPATRTSKGKIRKPRPNQNRSIEQDKAKSREGSRDREPESTPSSLSLSATPGTSSKTNSLDKSDKPVNKNSLEKKEPSAKGGLTSKDSPMTKSSDFSDFDSLMSQSVTSIGSDLGNGKKHESPISARYKKVKDSPKSDRKGRTDSPARVTKSKEREIIDKEPRTESPSRFKKSKDSPVSKHKQRRRDRDRDVDARNGKSEGTSESMTDNAAETQSQPVNRLSGIPANMNNNIFYLIDPTVKSKCKSVGDNLDSKRKSGDYSNRKSGDYSKRKSGDYSHRKSGDFGREGAKASKHKVTPSPDGSDEKADKEAVSPVKKERISPDRTKQSNDVQDTPL